MIYYNNEKKSIYLFLMKMNLNREKYYYFIENKLRRIILYIIKCLTTLHFFFIKVFKIKRDYFLNILI